MKHALSILALSALAACGGGGGSGGEPQATEPAQSAPTNQSPILTLTPVNTNCVQVAENHINCDLVSSAQPYGPGVPAGQFVSFTNRTGTTLQVTQVDASTGERWFWSEYCVYLGQIKDLTTAQMPAGKGEVGCSTKQIGEDYAPIRWGGGLAVAPGEMVMLNSHTDPAPTNHTYTLQVQYLSNGGHSWRQPQSDYVIPCNQQMQATAMTPWRNDTGRDVQLTGASIYSETPSSKAPNTASGGACIYVLLEGGAQKYANCDAALSTRGVVSFPPVIVAPGEYIAAQATNACSLGAHWNWAAWLYVK